MSNLLPDQAQRKIQGEYRARFMLVGSFVALGAAAFTFLALLPTYGALFVTRPAIDQRVSAAEQNKSESSEIARAQTLMTQLVPVAAASSSLSSAVSSAIAAKPAGVHIDSIVYTSGLVSTIALTGSVDGRAITNNYRAALSATNKFTSVMLPVGDLLGNKGGRFTITLGGAF